MLSRFFLLFTLFTSVLTYATTGDTPTKLFLRHKGKEIQIPFYKVNGILMNDICKDDTSKCMAFQAYENRSKNRPTLGSGNSIIKEPASSYCKKINGTALRLHDQKNNEWSICAFKDKTMVDAWGLVQK